LRVEHLQQREGRWVIVDLHGKGGRVRSVPIAGWVKAAIDRWLKCGGNRRGGVFRHVNRGSRVDGARVTDAGVYVILKRYAKLAPHDLRRSFAQMARRANASIEQIQMSLGQCLRGNHRALSGLEAGSRRRAGRPDPVAGLEIEAGVSAFEGKRGPATRRTTRSLFHAGVRYRERCSGTQLAPTCRSRQCQGSGFTSADRALDEVLFVGWDASTARPRVILLPESPRDESANLHRPLPHHPQARRGRHGRSVARH
jgi:hypothetical protein